MWIGMQRQDFFNEGNKSMSVSSVMKLKDCNLNVLPEDTAGEKYQSRGLLSKPVELSLCFFFFFLNLK